MAVNGERGKNERLKAARVPEGYHLGDHPRFSVTCDIVIMTMKDREPQVLLVRRRSAPFAGWWALPGGFKHPDETLDQTARRELMEETSFEAPAHLQQFRAYGDPGRDSRDNVVTVAYVAVVTEIAEIAGGSDAVEAALHPISRVVDGTLELAFDHNRIVSEARDFIAEQLETTDLATKFVPTEFSLTQLRNVFESFWGSELDGANFRRNLIEESKLYVRPTKVKGDSTPQGGRKPILFKATDAWRVNGSPIRRRRRKRN